MNIAINQITPLESFQDPMIFLLDLENDRFFKMGAALEYQGKVPVRQDLIEVVPKTAYDRAFNAWELLADHCQKLEARIAQLEKENNSLRCHL